MKTKTTSALYSRLKKIIEKTLPGEKLPSEPTLAKMLNVSRATLRETMQSFETEGWIRKQQGVGTFVVRPHRVIESGLEMLESIETLSERIGLEVHMGDLKVEIIEASDEIKKILQLKGETKRIISVSRVINAEDRPVAFLVDNLPVNIFSLSDISKGFSGSVLDLLLKRKNPLLANSKCEIKAITANQSLAKSLEIKEGIALLQLSSILYSAEGNPVDYSHSYFIPGYFSFHVVRSIVK